MNVTLSPTGAILVRVNMGKELDYIWTGDHVFDGGVTFNVNVDVDTGITIDGVDLSEHADEITTLIWIGW